jgi:hypothetical protein
MSRTVDPSCPQKCAQIAQNLYWKTFSNAPNSTDAIYYKCNAKNPQNTAQSDVYYYKIDWGNLTAYGHTQPSGATNIQEFSIPAPDWNCPQTTPQPNPISEPPCDPVYPLHTQNTYVKRKSNQNCNLL